MTNHEAITTPAAMGGPSPAAGWFLILDSPLADGRVDDAAKSEGPWFARRLLGLSIVLRLALTARAAGARGIVLPPGDEREAMKRALADDRLKIGVYEDGDPSLEDIFSTAPSLHVPANFVVHRAALGAMAALAARPQNEVAQREVAGDGSGDRWRTRSSKRRPS
jgi:hypothetical protein